MPRISSTRTAPDARKTTAAASPPGSRAFAGATVGTGGIIAGGSGQTPRPHAGVKECGLFRPPAQQEAAMADSVYRVTEVIGVSSESWEAAARTAVETAAKTVRDLRIAEVLRQDVTIENGQVTAYRVRLGISFKYDSGD
jgi:dodecin